MSVTRGGPNKRKLFTWDYDGSKKQLVIRNEKHKEHSYHLGEVSEALKLLLDRFGTHEFPLANNVEKLGDGTEQFGLGSLLYSLRSNTTFAQGASYLGVVLEEIGYLEWNGKHRGIAWRLTETDFSPDKFEQSLSRISKP